MNELFLLLLLFTLGVVAFCTSTLTAGGGGLMLVPVLSLLLGATQTAPILNTANLIARPSRLILFWKYINWQAVKYYLPAVIVGATSAGLFFSTIKVAWLQVIVGLFLISTIFQYGWGKRERSFSMTYRGLFPAGLLISFIGTFTGASGPVLNPFYLNLGITKEELIATKTFNSFFMGLAQLGSYAAFGVLSAGQWWYILALSFGMMVGNFIGKRLLVKTNKQTFQKWMIAFMMLSGALLLMEGIMTLMS
ncbi:MAG: sulfite exporter TauE/SafE family protein [Cyclobacteriaceae bacterium]|nr:sulfite exporter TauE/SafE family protein [Cyclobacteriaceae bacterium HetDA_MAG_MS6]